MMIKKTVFSLIITILLSLPAFAGENRVRSMAALSPQGTYLTPDSWSDPFYVNPALALFYDDFLVMQENSFVTKFNKGYYSFYNIELSMPSVHRAGLFLPYKNFRFGTEINISNNFFTYYGENGLDKKESDSLFIDGKALFAWQLNETLSIGFLLGGGSLLYDHYYNEASTMLPPIFFLTMFYGSNGLGSKRDYLADFAVYENFGLAIKRKRVESSFSIPFRFSYRKIKNSGAYSRDRGDWDYSSLKMSFDVALENVTTIKFNDRVSMRLNSTVSVVTEQISREYDSSYFSGGAIPYVRFTQVNVGEKLGLTMHHRLKSGNHLILYGFEIAHTALYGRGSLGVGSSSEPLTKGVNFLDLSTSFGSSHRINDHLTINTGIDSLIMRGQFTDYTYMVGGDGLRKISQPGEVERYVIGANYYFPVVIPAFQTSINLGFEIRPIRGFTVEAGVALVDLTPLNVLTIYYSVRMNCRFDLAFHWDIGGLRGEE